MKKVKYILGIIFAFCIIAYLVRVSSRVMESLLTTDIGMDSTVGFGTQAISILFIVSMFLFIGQNLSKFLIEIKGEESVGEELLQKLEKIKRIIRECFRLIYITVISFFGGFAFLNNASGITHILLGIAMLALSLVLVFIIERKITEIWNG